MSQRTRDLVFAWAVGLGLLLWAVVSNAEGYRWHQVARVDRAALTIEYNPVDLRGLRAIEREWTGESIPGAKGITRLLHNTDTGEWRCIVYHVAGAPQSVIKHEEQHCYGYDHD